MVREELGLADNDNVKDPSHRGYHHQQQQQQHRLIHTQSQLQQHPHHNPQHHHLLTASLQQQQHHRSNFFVVEEKKEPDHNLLDNPLSLSPSNNNTSISGMPIPINTSRPPSTASVPGGSSATGHNSTTPPRTTTSRRGGRTRSRSPPVVGGRGHAVSSPPLDGMTSPPPPPSTENNSNNNPSMAAAAAAAAAKAFSSAGGSGGPILVRNAWPETDDHVPPHSSPYAQQQQQQQHTVGHYYPHHPANFVDKQQQQQPSHYAASPSARQPPPQQQTWPGEPDPGRYGPPPPHASNYHHSSSTMRPRYQGGGGTGAPSTTTPYGEVSAEARSGAFRGYPDGANDAAAVYNDRRYRSAGGGHPVAGSTRYDPAADRGAPPRYPPPHRTMSNYPADYRYGGERPPPVDHHPHRGPHAMLQRTASAQPPQQQQQQQRSGGGTSLVLGGATPIHLPKTSSTTIAGNNMNTERRGSAASVFRGRPTEDASSGGRSSTSQPPRNGSSMEDANSPPNILLSFRTPTSSFEEMKGKAKNNATTKGGLSLSPNDPPRIQNSHHHHHQHQRQPDALFGPENSSEGLGSKPSASIDIAPSFPLFNQSFDSFGDNNYFHVDSGLQNDSFGMQRTASGDHQQHAQQQQQQQQQQHDTSGGGGMTVPLLQKNSSIGNASQQLLAASTSGGLTIGYSPVNSFGNVSIAPVRSREGGGPQTMYLGGPDARSSSPSQVLGMYRSYSGGMNSGRPEVESTMRLSVGSFGGPTLSYGGSRPYPEAAGSTAGGNAQPYYGGGSMRSNDGVDRGPHFYTILRKFKLAFKNCTFLLPGLKSALLEAPVSNSKDDLSTPDHHHRYGDPSPQDIVVARRRVESSVCAFGGSVVQGRSLLQTKDKGKDAIFRGKEDPDEQQSATVTPSSSIASPKGAQGVSQARAKYEEALAGRYYENESRLSWEFEESPPVDAIGDDSKKSKSEKGKDDDDDDDDQSCDSKDKDKSGDGGNASRSVDDADGSTKSQTSASPQPKMRYRCKLCGQPKQNHRCPYQQSLARSIGIMVYPAVNAFTAAEPGSIAAPLSDMNNFVDMKDMNMIDESPGRPTPERMHRPVTAGTVSNSTQITPESMRSNNVLQGSPFTTPARNVSRHRTLGRREGAKKRSYAHVGASDDHAELLFIESMELQHEQFRVISESKTRDLPSKFCYPALPLPYAQRKKLSDNLFSLSNEVPKLTDECAQVLREAREKDMWDLAVAELMTQVVVILHCPDGDKRFEGLRQYLLTLGIAC